MQHLGLKNNLFWLISQFIFLSINDKLLFLTLFVMLALFSNDINTDVTNNDWQ